MRTERDRARCVAVFVGPRCKGVGRSSIVFASKSTPGSRRLPYQILLSRPSELSGAEEISHALWLSVCAAHQSSTWVSFSSGLSGESAPVHWQKPAFDASVRSKKKKKKNSKKRVRRRTEIRRQQQLQRLGKFQRVSKLMPTWCYGNKHNSVVNQDFSKRFSMAYFWNPGLHEYLKISYLPENAIRYLFSWAASYNVLHLHEENLPLWLR